MNVKVHYATLIEVLMMAIEFGMDSAPKICVECVRSLRRELKLVKKEKKRKCAISLWKALSTVWTRGSMS